MTEDKQKYLDIEVQITTCRQRLTVVSETKTSILGRDSLGVDHRFSKRTGNILGYKYNRKHRVTRRWVTEGYYQTIYLDFAEGEINE